MISNLKETIHRVTAVVQKVLLREFVAEIRVPQTGEALLMVDPVGLSRLLCLNLAIFGSLNEVKWVKVPWFLSLGHR